MFRTTNRPSSGAQKLSSETRWAIKKHWNNKFYYTVASCWFFLWDLYYDARIHEHQTLCYSSFFLILPGRNCRKSVTTMSTVCQAPYLRFSTLSTLLVRRITSRRVDRNVTRVTGRQTAGNLPKPATSRNVTHPITTNRSAEFYLPNKN
jgi:hypothetical protein